MAQPDAPRVLFAVKGSRYLTHLKKLKDPEEPLERLMERASGLREKLVCRDRQRATTRVTDGTAVHACSSREVFYHHQVRVKATRKPITGVFVS
jgi:hypothetical protein